MNGMPYVANRKVRRNQVRVMKQGVANGEKHARIQNNAQRYNEADTAAFC